MLILCIDKQVPLLWNERPAPLEVGQPLGSFEPRDAHRTAVLASLHLTYSVVTPAAHTVTVWSLRVVTFCIACTSTLAG